jgi:hypothetical protein
MTASLPQLPVVTRARNTNLDKINKYHFQVQSRDESSMTLSLLYINVSNTSPIAPRAFSPLPLFSKTQLSFSEMYYFSHAFLLAILPLLTAAIPLAQPRASRGIAIPIAKRNNSSAGHSRYVKQNQNSIA